MGRHFCRSNKGLDSMIKKHFVIDRIKEMAEAQ